MQLDHFPGALLRSLRSGESQAHSIVRNVMRQQVVAVFWVQACIEQLHRSVPAQLDLPGDVYFIKTLPVLVQWPDLVLVCASSILICFLATLYPSWEASRMVPVDAIRNV